MVIGKDRSEGRCLAVRFLVFSQPVEGDRTLGIFQADLPRAHLVVKGIFQLIFFSWSRLALHGLGPQVGQVIGPAQAGRHQLIDAVDRF